MKVFSSPTFQVPYLGETGLSAGVLLMNLTRIRDLPDISWNHEVMEIYGRYRNDIVLADQDI